MKIRITLEHDEFDRLPGLYAAPADVELEGMLEVEVTMPDGRTVTAVERPAAGLVQNAVVIGQGDERAYSVSRGFIGVDPCDNDEYEVLRETDSHEGAVTFGLGLAAELGQPLIDWMAGGRVCLFSPLEVVVTDRLGTMSYVVTGESFKPTTDIAPEFNPLSGLLVLDDSDHGLIVDAVKTAWGAPCRVVVRPLPICDPEIVMAFVGGESKAVDHE